MTRARVVELGWCVAFGTVVAAGVFGGVLGAAMVLLLLVSWWFAYLVLWRWQRNNDRLSNRRLAGHSMHLHDGRPCYGEHCGPFEEQERAA